MSGNKGITLIALIFTVVLLAMLAGVIIFNIGDTYENSRVMQFTSYMKMIQKKVDNYCEEGREDYGTLGQNLSEANKARLQTIINNDSKNLIDTETLDSTNIRYFNSEDINKYFEISDIKDEIVVNFENREVISLNGVEKDKSMYYVERGL